MNNDSITSKESYPSKRYYVSLRVICCSLILLLHFLINPVFSFPQSDEEETPLTNKKASTKPSTLSSTSKDKSISRSHSKGSPSNINPKKTSFFQASRVPSTSSSSSYSNTTTTPQLKGRVSPPKSIPETTSSDFEEDDDVLVADIRQLGKKVSPLSEKSKAVDAPQAKRKVPISQSKEISPSKRQRPDDSQKQSQASTSKKSLDQKAKSSDKRPISNASEEDSDDEYPDDVLLTLNDTNAEDEIATTGRSTSTTPRPSYRQQENKSKSLDDEDQRPSVSSSFSTTSTSIGKSTQFPSPSPNSSKEKKTQTSAQSSGTLDAWLFGSRTTQTSTTPTSTSSTSSSSTSASQPATQSASITSASLSQKSQLDEKEVAILKEGKIDLTVGLLSEDIKNFSDAYEENSDSQQKFPILINTQNEPQGLIILERKISSDPWWFSKIKNHLASESLASQLMPQQHTEQVKSGLVFVKAPLSTRIFVFIFGNGRYLLKSEVKDTDFGLRIALNNLNPKGDKTLKSFAINILGLNSIDIVTRYSQGMSIRALPQQPLQLQKLTHIASAREGVRIASAGSYAKVYAPYDIKDFPEICRALLSVHNKKDYESYFLWRNKLKFERDGNKVKVLDNKLVSLIKNGTNEFWYLKLPDNEDFHDQTKATSFNLKRKKKSSNKGAGARRAVSKFEVLKPNSSLNDIEKYLVTSNNLSHTALKEHLELDALDEQGHVLETWNLHKLLVAESKDEQGQTYILTNGGWYNLDSDFNSELNGNINKLFSSVPALPPVKEDELKKNKDDTKIDTEGLYNKRVANESHGDLLLMDRRLIIPIEERDPHHLGHKLEICDLLSTSQELIHVKDWVGSGTFSHLLCQGEISGHSLLKSKAREKAKQAFLIGEIHNELTSSPNILKKSLDTKDAKSKFREAVRRASQDITRNTSLSISNIEESLQKHLSSYVTRLPQGMGKMCKNGVEKFIKILPVDNFDPKNYTIVYAFFHESTTRANLSEYLPFFSRLNLINRAERLEKLGYKVKVVRIQKPIQPKAPNTSTTSSSSTSTSSSQGSSIKVTVLKDDEDD